MRLNKHKIKSVKKNQSNDEGQQRETPAQYLSFNLVAENPQMGARDG